MPRTPTTGRVSGRNAKTRGKSETKTLMRDRNPNASRSYAREQTPKTTEGRGGSSEKSKAISSGHKASFDRVDNSMRKWHQKNAADSSKSGLTRAMDRSSAAARKNQALSERSRANKHRAKR